MQPGDDGLGDVAGMVEPPVAPDGPVPELEDLLKGIPASTQELIDALFRGRFVGVQVIDRKNLW